VTLSPKVKSNFLSDSFFIFLTRFFPSLANLLVLIWYSKKLPQTDYGDYQHFWIQLNVFYPLACFGIHVLVITYSPGLLKALYKKINAIHYSLYALWIMLLSAIFGLLQYNALEVNFLVPFLFLATFSLAVILESLLVVSRSFRILLPVNILYAAIFFFLHQYILTTGFSLQALFTGLLLLSAARLCIYAAALYLGRRQATAQTIEEKSPDLVSIISLWLHLGFYDIVQSLFNWIDKFIVSLVLTAAVSAIYFNGSQNIPFLPLLLSAAGSGVLLQLATVTKANEKTETLKFMNQLGRLLSCIVFPLFFYLFFFRHQLITTILTDKYIPAIPIFTVAIFVLPVKAYSFTTVLQRMHKGAIINVGSIVDLITACGLMYPLYKWFGLPGVALSFVITTYLQAGFYLYYSARLLRTSMLKLIPVANWLIKLIVFASLLIAYRYVAAGRFQDKITLILGGVLTLTLIIVSLFIEFAKQKKHGSL
jgi:O-antigen/teichoic acid export membrane protein